MKTLKKISLIIIGIILSLVILEIGLQTISYVNNIVKDYQINKQIKNKDSITILCLGESTTDNQWPPILQKILDEKSTTKKFNVIDEGHEATRTNYLIQHIIDKKLDMYKPNIIISMIGINDNDKIVEQITKFRFKSISLLYLILKHIHINDVFAQNTNNNFEFYFNKAINAYHNKEYEKAIDIYVFLNKHFPQQKEKFIIDEILAYKFSQRPINDLEPIILDLIKISPFFASHEVIEFCCRTNNVKLLKELFLKDDVNDSILKSIDKFILFRDDIKKLGVQELVDKIDIIATACISKNDINNNFVYGFFATKNYLEKNYTYANKLYAIQNNLLCTYYCKMTFESYKKLINISKSKNIKLIAMQYPIRSIKPLKQMLKPFDNITFISNENNFKKALQNHKYEDLFRDRFAGDFGHCTELGNTLIAENVAETILKLYN